LRTQPGSPSTRKQSNFVSSPRIRISTRCCSTIASRRWHTAAPERVRCRSTIENAITPLLPHGKAQLGAVAQMLGVSSRTLARKLAAEGLSFGEILSQLRSDLAAHYLSDPNLPISEIAWLVGYQGVSAFSHGYT